MHRAQMLQNCIHIQYDGKAAAAYSASLVRLARRFLDDLRLGGVELSLSLVTDVQMRKLNRKWRKKDCTTDVLSFPAGDFPAVGCKLLGDVVISFPTARMVAKARGVTVSSELARYLAHGLLHLLGYTHHKPEEAWRMARAEQWLLGHEGMLQAR